MFRRAASRVASQSCSALTCLIKLRSAGAETSLADGGALASCSFLLSRSGALTFLRNAPSARHPVVRAFLSRLRDTSGEQTSALAHHPWSAVRKQVVGCLKIGSASIVPIRRTRSPQLHLTEGY